MTDTGNALKNEKLFIEQFNSSPTYRKEALDRLGLPSTILYVAKKVTKGDGFEVDDTR